MTKKVKIRTLGRIISDIPDFGLYGVAGMLVDGVLTVFWSTGVDATSTLEYGINDPNPDNFTAISKSETVKHHEIPFPETFVGTDHFFRVRSTDPITGVEKVSAIYRVFVAQTIFFASIAGSVEPSFLPITVHDPAPFNHINIDTNISRANIGPTLSETPATLFVAPYEALTIPDHDSNRPIGIVTNILTTTVA